MYQLVNAIQMSSHNICLYKEIKKKKKKKNPKIIIK